MRLWAAAWSLVLVLWAAPAFAQQDSDVNTAYQLAAEGLQAFDAGSYSESLDKFTRAFAIVRVPSLALYMARANARLGHLLAARELYAEVARLPDGVGDPDVQHAARRAAVAEAQSLIESIPRVAVQVPGTGGAPVSVLIDSTRVPSSLAFSGWQVDPGPHQVTVSLGTQQQTQLVFLVEGELKTVLFRFQSIPEGRSLETDAPRPGSAAHTRMTKAGWVSLALGGAGFALSGVTAALALSKRADLEEKGAWDVNHCERAASARDCDDYAKLRTYSTVAFYAGAVGVATGITLLLFAPPAQTSPKKGLRSRLTPMIGAGYAGVLGEFD